MVAVAGGLISALCWTATGLLGQRASRAIGELSTFAWAALFGLLFVSIPAAVALSGPGLSASTLLQLGLAGVLNVGGLIVQFGALRRGLVSVITPISSTEGAVAAMIAVIAGARFGAIGWVALATVLCGVLVSAVGAWRRDRRGRQDGALAAIALASAAALMFGTGLFFQGHAGRHVPLGLAVAPPSVMGAVLVTTPLVSVGRLARLRTVAVITPLIAAAEVLGFVAYVAGARDSVPIAAVLSAQYATVSVVIGMVFLGERLSRLQIAGYAIIVAGVALLSLPQ